MEGPLSRLGGDNASGGLLGFLAGWRRRGHQASVEQCAAAQDLLLLLADQGRLPEDERDLAGWLAPIFTRNAGEQSSFREEFHAWVDASPGRPPPGATARIRADADVPGAEFRHAMRKTSPWRWVFLTVALVALGTLVLWLTGGPKPQVEGSAGGRVIRAGSADPVGGVGVIVPNKVVVTDANGDFATSWTVAREEPEVEIIFGRNGYVTQIVKVTASGAPTGLEVFLAENPENRVVPPDPGSFAALIEAINRVADAERELIDRRTRWELLYARHRGWLRWAAGAAALGAFLGLALWRRSRRRLVLQRGRGDALPELARVHVGGDGAQILPPERLRAAARALARRHASGTLQLHPAASAAATVHQGGCPTPVYRARRRRLEYLALIDRRSFEDQDASRVEALVRALDQSGIPFDWAFFDGDARWCSLPRDVRRGASLDELRSRFGDRTLLVFSDGAALLDPVSGARHAWVDDLLLWPRRILLTPRAAGARGRRERALAAAGFEVAEATARGIALLNERLERWATNDAPLEALPPLPRRFEVDALRLLEDRELDERERAAIDVELLGYLGVHGYRWLAACAVYPELSWPITLYLGRELRAMDGTPLLTEDRLARLVQLPWFRYGRLPDWLREQLLARLDPRSEADTRRALRALIVSRLGAPRGGATLLIARSRRGKRVARDVVSVEARVSPLRDRVFLRTVFGAPPRLALAVPGRLRRLLFVGGEPLFGLRTSVLGLAAVLAAGLPFLAPDAPPPQLEERVPVPRFRLVEEPSPSEPTKGGGGEVAMAERPLSEQVAAIDGGTWSALETERPGEERSALYVVWLRSHLAERGVPLTDSNRFNIAQPPDGERIELRRERPGSAPTPLTSPRSSSSIPPGTNYRVSAGETLFLIAERAYGNGMLWSAIFRANPWVDPDHVETGTVLYIPVLEDSPSDLTPVVPGFTFIEKNAFGYAEYLHERSGIVFVYLPGGKFSMGSPEGEAEHSGAEGPVHEVELSPFLIAKYELSQAEWKRVMTDNPSAFWGDDLPAEQVSWEDAKAFCKKTGLALPTEAQWEYACRAGTTTPFAFGETVTTDQVNYNGNFPYGDAPKGEYRKRTVPVKSFAPNAFGLYQMHGNVYERCEDVYDEKFYGKPGATRKDPVCISGSAYRVVWGGCWSHNAGICRSANRNRDPPDDRVVHVGFRPSAPLP